MGWQLLCCGDEVRFLIPKGFGKTKRENNVKKKYIYIYIYIYIYKMSCTGVECGVERNIEVLQHLSMREGRRDKSERENVCPKFLSK